MLVGLERVVRGLLTLSEVFHSSALSDALARCAANRLVAELLLYQGEIDVRGHKVTSK
jgi:hypothetical protein